MRDLIRGGAAAWISTVALGLGVATAALLAATSPAVAQSRAAPEPPSGFAPKPLATAQRWMVAAAHPLAAEAGRETLRSGGTAIDAAIAAQLALNVVEPQSSGIGGGGFALSWDAAAKRLDAVDGRETAPAAASPALFLGDDGAPLPFIPAATSGRAIGAPGLVRMLAMLHEDGGVLPWAQLFAPAIRLAEDGFPVSPRLNASLAFQTRRLTANPAAKALFFDADGEALPVGAILKQPQLAESLRAIAAGGADAFYTGRVAEAVVSAAQSEPRPGALSVADLAGYTAVRRAPVCAPLRGGALSVCGMPPPSSGGVGVAQILALMEAADPSYGAEEASGSSAHLFLEASRLAYADRNRYLADPDFIPQPIEGLLAPDYIAERALLMDVREASPDVAEPGAPPGLDAAPAASSTGADAPGTTHISVVDGAGNVVALTSSIEIAFGSGRMAAGFFLNNQLTDFSFTPVKDGAPVANAAAPGKRPRSSMAPTIIFDGDRPVLALGSPGGSRIIEYVAWAAHGVVVDGLDPAEAASRPQLSHRNRTPAVVEARSDADALATRLRARGHMVNRASLTSGLHIIAIGPDGALSGGVDPRREGAALGD
ncbi:MAG: gamma-glutamyltransferase [Pseudomonadota bacterium]